MDALYLAFAGSLRDGIRAELARRTRDAAAARTSVCVELGGFSFALGPRSRDGFWTLQNQDLRIVIDDSAGNNACGLPWVCVVQPSAQLLARVGPLAVFEHSHALAELFLGNVIASRVRRLDLCADIAGLHVSDVDPRAFVLPARTEWQKIAVFKEYARNGKRTGFVAGRSNLRARIYDKLEELSLSRNDDKRAHEHARFRERGWDGCEPVTRVEFELHGDALDEFDEGLRDHVSRLLSRVASVWSYCTKKWLRIVERDASTRAARCPPTPMWRLVQSAFGDVERVDRIRRPPRGRAALAVSAAINFCASEPFELPEIHVANLPHVEAPAFPWGATSPPHRGELSRGAGAADGREATTAGVMAMSDAASALWVRNALRWATRRAADARAQELLATYGPQETARYIVERFGAARAKRSRSLEQWVERRAIAEEHAA